MEKESSKIYKINQITKEDFQREKNQEMESTKMKKGPFTKGNFMRTKSMGKVFYILEKESTKGISKRGNLMEKESSSIQMGITMKAISSTIKKKDLEL